MARAQYDYVVVGGGTSGAVVAAGLAERSEATVCLVEAGPDARGVAAVRDAWRWEELLGSDLDFDFGVEAEAGGNAALRLPAGRTLGGSSSINTSFAFDAPDCDLHAWESAGAFGWGPDVLGPYRERVAATVGAEVVATPHPLSEAFLESAVGEGFALVEHGGASLEEGAGWMPLSSRAGRRQSRADLYLRDERRGLTIRTGTPVRRVVIERDRTVAVETVEGEAIAAGTEIVLCAGAINTPKLLMLSGIGPEAELRRHGIETVVALGAVGSGLTDHPLGLVVWSSQRTSSVSHGWEAGVLARSSDTLEHPDLFLMLATHPYGERHGAGCTMAMFPMRPRSTGSVRLAGADPGTPPVIHIGHLSDPEAHDLAVTRFGFELARRLAGRGPLRALLEEEVQPGRHVHDDELDAYLRRTADSMYHPVGTCRMGADDAAPVTPDLRLRHTEGLRIADASVFPSIVSVTPYLTCLTVAERCVDLMLHSQGAT